MRDPAYAVRFPQPARSGSSGALRHRTGSIADHVANVASCSVVIHDVDETLRAIIERSIVDGGDVEVSLDAPTRDWGVRQNKPTINAFLYDIREDLARRDMAPVAITNEAGTVIGREAPPRRFRLSYLLTAWTQRPEDEHRLLSGLLSTFLAFDQIPGGDEGYLVGSLAESAVPTLLTLALPPPQDRSLSDIWSALGGELKPSLDLVIIAPLEPGRTFQTGKPVLELPRFQVGDFEVDPADITEERKKRSNVAHPAPAEDIDDPDKPETHRRQVGMDEFPGRTFEIRRL